METIIPFVSCVCNEAEFSSALESGFSEIYVVTSTGVLKHQKLSGGRHIRLKVESVPAKVKEAIEKYAPPVQEEINFLPGGKIPMRFYNQVVKFFKEVMRVKNADHEAHCFILWSKENGYFISVPKQSVSKASVSFTYDKEAIPDGSVVVVDLHSHNTMGAFFSGTDNNNDKNGIYYSGVVGHLDKPQHAFVMRFNLHETKREVELKEIFEEEVSDVEVPKEWLDQVEVKAPVYSGKPSVGKPWEADQRVGRPSIPPEFESMWDMQMKFMGLDPDSVPRGTKREGQHAISDLPFGYLPGIDDDDQDPVGGISSDEEYDYVASQYGVPAAEAKEQIETYLIDIEGKDEILRDILTQVFNSMSREAQERIQTYGL